MADYEAEARAAELRGQAKAARIRAQALEEEANKLLGKDRETIRRQRERELQALRNSPGYIKCSICDDNANIQVGGDGRNCYVHSGRC